MPNGAKTNLPKPLPSPPVCAACHQSLSDSYFEINRTIVCEACRDSIEDQLRGGSRFARFSKAALHGLVASIVGAAVYLAFQSFSSYDWSLVAIFTGYLVGKMVRKGGGGLGGTAYQMLAVVLTYASLGLTYFSFALLQRDQVARLFPLAPGELISILGQAFLVPLLRMRSSPITIAFFGFALWVAWKLNKSGRFVVSGPHRVGQAGSGRPPT
jgi:hypothetical protein